MSDFKEKVQLRVNEIRDELFNICRYIYENPERWEEDRYYTE